MRKIILLLMLSCGLSSYSQDCLIQILEPHYDTYFCPDAPSLEVPFEVIHTPEPISQISLVVTNLTQGVKEIFYIDNPEVGFPYLFSIDPNMITLNAGDEVEIFAEAELTNSFCNSNILFTTVPACSTLDQDNDGYTADVDCKDNNPSINPGADESCGNGIDDNCNNEVDEGCVCPDEDGDQVCDADDNCPALYNPGQEPDADCDGVPTSEDCNDNDPNIGSNANDADCDGVSSNIDCNDNDASITSTNVKDADCDGVPTSEDCNDNDPNVGSNVNDADCDGVPSGEDCNDSDPNIGRNANDADCDGVPTAEDCNDNDASVTTLIDDDSDLDGILDCDDAEINSPCPLNVDNRGISMDSDNDGVLDCLDNCPEDRDKIEPGDCGCGVQDDDTDGDGVLDCNDQEVRSRCLTVDSNGVSKDSDNDGVLDCDDQCPGFDDTLDVDKDKIPDGCDLDNSVRGVPICHVGNNGRSRTIYVSPQQKERHLAHGDEPGTCISPNTQLMLADDNALSEEQVVLYPNPASQELNVQVHSNLSSDAVLSVHNFSGNTYMQFPVSEGGLYTLELDGRFVSGMYFVKIIDGPTEVTKQFVVK